MGAVPTSLPLLAGGLADLAFARCSRCRVAVGTCPTMTAPASPDPDFPAAALRAGADIRTQDIGKRR